MQAKPWQRLGMNVNGMFESIGSLQYSKSQIEIALNAH